MTTDIELALAKGKIVGARKLLQEEFLKQDKAEFEAKLRAEYDELYPEYEYAEVYDYDDLTNDDDYLDWELVDGSRSDGIQIYKRVLKREMTFEEYKNETRVVSEASYVCDECQLALEDDKCINNAEHTTRLIPEVTELVRPYIPNDVSDKVDAYIKSRYAELRKNEYPSIEEQLDMLFKADWDGWRSIIRSIKEKYPKPDEEQ